MYKKGLSIGVLLAALAGCHNSPGGKHEQTLVTPSTRLEAPSDTAALDTLVKSSQYPQLADAIAHMKPSTERKYFDGILANGEGKVKQSAELLAGIVPDLKRNNPARAAQALQAVARDYVQMFRYSDASRTYEDLLHNFSSQMTADELQSTRDDAGAVRLMQAAAPQTITFGGMVDVPTQHEPGLGTLDANVTAGAVSSSWILDSGANFSTVSTSFAQRLHVPLSSEKAQTQGVTGAENTLRVAVLPQMQLGNATVRDVILLVLDDKNLDVQTGARSHHQIEAILGYPVLQALGRLTFVSGKRLLAGPGSPGGDGGAPIFLDGLTPLLECTVENRKVLFSFDTGATFTVYSGLYAKEFPAQMKDGKRRTRVVTGAGGSKKENVIVLPHPKLTIGDTTVALQNVPVMSALGSDGDKFSGNLGRDVVNPYSSFTIDFGAMRFRLGKKL